MPDVSPNSNSGPSSEEAKPDVTLSDRSDGRASQQAILQATLDVVLRDGVGGVKYKTVADRSGVSHSAIAYYFKDIPSLINKAFTYYLDSYAETMKFRRNMGKRILKKFKGQDVMSPLIRQKIVEVYVEEALDIVASPSDKGQAFMKLDQLFRNETERHGYFKEELSRQDKMDMEAIEWFFGKLQTPNPELDAFQMMSVLWLCSVSMINNAHDDASRLYMKQRIAYTLSSIMGLSDISAEDKNAAAS
ncbi:TetR/AcrR family transcriptional regulator [Maricurvus nonylphenolicus]|uniref:TetR/AcrR family transcriptional regulator n=1 Tax=Maricurvus nonylphenolicus TaxID=1008307 RepID=UPI0036F22653